MQPKIWKLYCNFLNLEWQKSWLNQLSGGAAMPCWLCISNFLVIEKWADGLTSGKWTTKAFSALPILLPQWSHRDHQGHSQREIHTSLSFQWETLRILPLPSCRNMDHQRTKPSCMKVRLPSKGGSHFVWQGGTENLSPPPQRMLPHPGQ